MQTEQPHDLDPSVIPEVSLEAFKTQALYEGTPLSMLGSVALVTILSLSHWTIIGHGSLIVWNLLILSAIFIRTVTWYIWKQNKKILSTAHWLTLFRAGAWLAGAAWGSSAFLMFASYDPSYQALLAYTIAGVSSGSFTTMAYDKRAALGFVILAIFPLTLRLFMEDGPIAVPMAIMSVIYLGFVMSAAARGRKTLVDQHEKKMRLLAWSKERVNQQKINKSISQAKTLFIKDANSHTVFTSLLQDTLELTASQFGFIGELARTADGKLEVHLHAISATQDTPLIRFYLTDQELSPSHPTSLLPLKNIPFANAILQGKPIISNDPNNDLRDGGLPPDHPPLKALFGMPIFISNSQVALLVLANRPDGYQDQLMEVIKPVSETLVQFFEAILHKRQQKLYETQLHNNAKHTQAILDEVFDAIITMDQYGIIKSFNHAAEMIFGYRAAETINSSIYNLIPQPASAASADPSKSIHQTILDGQEQIGIRRNGKEFPVNIATSTIMIEGEPLIISVVRDMSESKRNEELKNQFISTLNHELRTPLTAIAGALGILNSAALGSNSEQQQKLISIAQQNSLKLQSLINDLLDIDKLVANKMELEFAPHNIKEIVSKAIEYHQTYASKNNVKWQLTCPAEDILVYGDSRRIHQVLANLLSNAAKFSPLDSCVDIEITHTGKMAKIIVTDRGEGIPESFKHKIFQRFMQADSSDTRQQSGSGLGLAISKELVQKMGGNIGFVSKEGKGSSFYFELPLAEDNRPTPTEV